MTIKIQGMEFKPQIFWNSRLNKQWDLRGVGYTSLGLPFNIWMYKVRAAIFVRALPECTNGENILDIGSGTGFYVDLWKKAGCRVSGIDISADAVTKLQEKYPQDTFVIGDIGSLDFIQQSLYDGISAMDVLFHIIDDSIYQRALKNIYNCLKPGGYFLYAENMPESRVTFKHQVSRSRDEVIQSLVAAGFRIESISPMFFLMNQPIAANGTAIRLWWRVLSGILIRHPATGNLLGALLYPLELAILRLSSNKNGPSTKLLLCRKD